MVTATKSGKITFLHSALTENLPEKQNMSRNKGLRGENENE